MFISHNFTQALQYTLAVIMYIVICDFFYILIFLGCGKFQHVKLGRLPYFSCGLYINFTVRKSLSEKIDTLLVDILMIERLIFKR